MAENKLPEELQKRLDGMLEETKETRAVLDALDKELFSSGSPTPERLAVIAAHATGGGNYLRKKLGKLVALVRNEEANRFLAIKLEAAQANSKVTESATNMEATAYVGPIRLVREIINSYVVSADNLVSYCRMQNLSNNGYHSSERTHVEVEV